MIHYAAGKTGTYRRKFPKVNIIKFMKRESVEDLNQNCINWLQSFTNMRLIQEHFLENDAQLDFKEQKKRIDKRTLIDSLSNLYLKFLGGNPKEHFFHNLFVYETSKLQSCYLFQPKILFIDPTAKHGVKLKIFKKCNKFAWKNLNCV